MKQSAMAKYENCDLDSYLLENFIFKECDVEMDKMLDDSGYTMDEDFSLFMYNFAKAYVTYAGI